MAQLAAESVVRRSRPARVLADASRDQHQAGERDGGAGDLPGGGAPRKPTAAKTIVKSAWVCTTMAARPPASPTRCRRTGRETARCRESPTAMSEVHGMGGRGSERGDAATGKRTAASAGGEQIEPDPGGHEGRPQRTATSTARPA